MLKHAQQISIVLLLATWVVGPLGVSTAGATGPVPPDVAAANQYREIVPTAAGGVAAVDSAAHPARVSDAISQTIEQSQASDKPALAKLASSAPARTPRRTSTRTPRPTSTTGLRVAARPAAAGAGGFDLTSLWYVLAALSLASLGVIGGRLSRR